MRVTKAKANWVARLADDGMARAISPQSRSGTVIRSSALHLAHTPAVCRDVTQVGTAAALVLEQAFIRGALAAQK